jgi:hypothetical protein
LAASREEGWLSRTNHYAGSGNWISAQENRHGTFAMTHGSLISVFYKLLGN